MAHLVYTDGRSRFELNLPEDARFVADLCVWLTDRAEAAGATGDGPADVQVDEPEAVAPAPAERPARWGPELGPVPRLLPRTCERPECTTVFQPKRRTDLYCSRPCKTAVANAVALAKRRAKGGAYACKEPGCEAAFPTAAALGGHVGSHVKDRRSGATKAKLNGSAGVTSAVKALAPKSLPVSAHTMRVAKAEVTPEDRPYRCKEPGCGHPCRSQGDLESHRRAFHDTRKGLPKVTEVLGAMQFPCPHEDCERHTRPYDDENRLTHHLRVIHDFEFVEPVHEVQAHVPAMAVKVG